ncbi:MAG: DUF1330 domain-containing protein [Burkholderiaceae bacterium]
MNANAYAIGHLEEVRMGSDIVRYLQEIDATLAPFRGRFLVHGDPLEMKEGALAGAIIVIEFPDLDSARAWYASPAYREILPLRTANARGTVFLVNGVPADHRATDVLAARH